MSIVCLCFLSKRKLAVKFIGNMFGKPSRPMIKGEGAVYLDDLIISENMKEKI